MALSVPETEDLDDELSDETADEQLLRKQSEVVLSESRQKLVDWLVDRLMLATDALCPQHPLRPYQIPFARRIFESLVIDDGDCITALFCRQSGKTEAVANVVATAMIFLPRLAKVYPELLEKYAEGVLVGAFAPVDEQADNLFGRIVARLSSDEAEALLKDPEIDDRIKGRGRRVWLQNCLSEVRKTTCHPKAKIEGRTYHIILIDEAQDADTKTINKSVSPMGTATNATQIWTGTCTYNKNVFWDQIQNNKRAVLSRGAFRQNYFEANWKVVAKYVPQYRKAIRKEMGRMGVDSDEFRLSYNLEWLLDKGQFTTSEKFAALGDITVQSLEQTWFHSPVVVGIDCGRIQDKTVITVVWVDWDHPDALGYYEHRIINWLDLEGLEWEDQYFRIYDFLQHYKVWAVGVDTGGIGDLVIGRLRSLMPRVNFVSCPDPPAQQSDRFKYLKTLMDRHRMIWPMGAKVRRLKVFRRFRQEMEDAELEYKGPNMSVAAPNARDAHDDYVDSLANAVSLTRGGIENAAEQPTVCYDNFLFKPSRRY